MLTILPATGGVAPRFDDSSEKLSDRYMILENHMAIANFGGMPSITIPFTKLNDLPIGVNITCKAREDAKTLTIAKHVEDVTGLKGIYKEV